MKSLFNRLFPRKIPSKIFTNSQFEKEFEEKGYIIIDLFDSNIIQQCLSVYKESDSLVGRVKYNTLEIDQASQRKWVAKELEKIISTFIYSQLNGYKIFGYNFAVKKANSFERFNAHMDDEHTDEEIYKCVNVWIPLTNVDAENGALYLLAGSHKVKLPPRGIGLPFAYMELQEFIEQKSTPMPMKVGQALFFNPRLIHGSGFNLSDQDRPAIVVGLVPKQAPLYVLMRHDGLNHGYYEKFSINEDFFFEVEIGKRPKFARSLGVFKFPALTYNLEEIKKLVR